MQRNLTCIICPRGCNLVIELDDEGKIESVSGNACKRGIGYAEDECTAPKRSVTSTVRCEGGGLIAVKTASPIPKSLVFECMKKINGTHAKSDVKIGDVIIKNVLGTGVDIIASGNKML
ncbi:MAG: DUF1667 domain-containing protein [Clostridia bacterium]|nr:DUF1667 domain-containing protein [Clostridia bacterium]